MKASALCVVRWIIGGCFVYLGWVKTRDPVAFLKVIREFNLLQAPLLMNVVAAWLPWFECWCGLLLVLGVGVRAAAMTLAGLLAAFSIMVWLRALQLMASFDGSFCSLSFDCGCGSGEVFVCQKLLQNGCLFIGALLLVWQGAGRLALWPKVGFLKLNQS